MLARYAAACLLISFALGELVTDGPNIILKETGKPFKIRGISWFGMESSWDVFQGLHVVGLDEMILRLQSLGFNVIRVPLCVTSIITDPVVKDFRLDGNPKLRGLTHLQILDEVVEAAGRVGIMILFDMHTLRAGEYTPSLWFDEETPEKKYYKALDLLIKRYNEKCNVMGIELWNEPKQTGGNGVLGRPKTSVNIHSFTMKTAERVLLRSDWLVFASGYPSQSNAFPGQYFSPYQGKNITLSRPKLVFAAHMFGPSVAWQEWMRYPKMGLDSTWKARFEAISNKTIVFTAWGGDLSPEYDEKIMDLMAEKFVETGLTNVIFWALNPTEQKIGGLLQDDWRTVNVAKLDIMELIQPEPTRMLPCSFQKKRFLPQEGRIVAVKEAQNIAKYIGYGAAALVGIAFLIIVIVRVNRAKVETNLSEQQPLLESRNNVV